MKKRAPKQVLPPPESAPLDPRYFAKPAAVPGAYTGFSNHPEPPKKRKR